MKSVSNIEISLDNIKEGLQLCIDARRPGSLFIEDDDSDYNEAKFQLLEGCNYDYQINDPNFVLGDIGDNIIQQHKRSSNLGTISPNIFVGTLSIPLLEKVTLRECFKIQFEVQSIKSSYRYDYRDMLELITEKCTELLLQADSPVSQHFEVDYSSDSQTLYQKFAFIKSVIGTDEFAEAVHRIVTAPVTKWTETNEEKDIRNARRFSNTNIKEIIKGSNRTSIPKYHYLRKYGLDTLPGRITTIRKTDSVDTPENRFIKQALEIFLKFCTDINNKAKEFNHKQMENESELLIRNLENQLNHSVFKKISRPTTLKLNSPVLQRKEGYREVLRVWLMFNLAAKLIWKGGDDIYFGGKKDIATLYEYWLFFKLLDLCQTIFDIEPKDISDLIKETPDGLNLQIQQGKFTALHGVYDVGNRKLNIQFNYNRSFSGKKSYPDSGSWTTTLRPDYTLSFWPFGISEQEAEEQELIVHVHFDAKYKIANLTDFIEHNSEHDLNEQKTENRKGIYKNADLLKMHAYKDAIRRTGGAYVLYPGDKSINQKGFHEILPGLGAFPVKPSKTDNGLSELKAFILEIIEHFLNRTSQREKFAHRTYDVFKTPPDKNNILKEALPEAYGVNRNLLPDETFVLIGFYKSEKHLDWIKKRRLYNFRMDGARGAITLTAQAVSSKYLLLHTSGQNQTSELWKIVSNGFRVVSQKTMERLNYPSPKQQSYLTLKIEKVSDTEFENVKFDFTKLNKYTSGRVSSFPFTTSIAELIKSRIN
jgi:predicted component of viral defense system (DUF524 family)